MTTSYMWMMQHDDDAYCAASIHKKEGYYYSRFFNSFIHPFVDFIHSFKQVPVSSFNYQLINLERSANDTKRNKW